LIGGGVAVVVRLADAMCVLRDAILQIAPQHEEHLELQYDIFILRCSAQRSLEGWPQVSDLR
jgi:hypothetical protein